MNPSPELDSRKAWVLFRFPHETNFYFLTQADADLHRGTVGKSAGFYMAPFRHRSSEEIYIPLAGSALQRFSRDVLKDVSEPPSLYRPVVSVPDHERRVAEAIKAIRENRLLKKIVLSNRLDAEKEDCRPLAVFKRMTEKYPGAFVYYWHHPAAGGDWAGASPELLLGYAREKESGLFTGETVSLAGTKLSDQNRPWTDKEREEQELVSRYIRTLLTRHRLAFSSDGPVDVRQGNLVHLKTDFTFLFQDSDLIPRLLYDLHPTPAVAGVPKKTAMEHISRLEGYDREFYTGFTGFAGPSAGRLFVNLRSMQLHPRKVMFYAGGGITAASDPEAEWEEVKRKWNIMQSVFS